MNDLTEPSGEPGAERGLSVAGIGKAINRRPILRDVSMNLVRGEIVALLGPNGAGKTTCFHVIAGLVPPDTGSVRIDGTEITDLPMYRRARLGLGYLPQEPSVFRGLSAEDNIRAVVEFWVDGRRNQNARVDELVEEFSIGHVRKSSAIVLSGGERRRVEIARCLASGPSYILLDEPFAGVDPIAVADIRNLILNLRERNIGVLITDHNVRETLGIVDRAYILHAGSVLMAGTPQEVAAHDDVRKIYLGTEFEIGNSASVQDIGSTGIDQARVRKIRS